MEVLERLKELTKKEVSLSSVCEELELNDYEVLGFVRELRLEGINISIQKKDDDIYLFNKGEKELNEDNTYKFETDENNEFKFITNENIVCSDMFKNINYLNMVSFDDMEKITRAVEYMKEKNKR